ALDELVKHLDEQNSWKTLNLIPEVSTLNELKNSLDSILNQKNGFAESFSKTPSLISLHRPSREKLDLLLIAEINDLKTRNLFSNIQEAFLGSGYQKRKREYQNRQIIEISRPGGAMFSYMLYKNFFVGSFSAVLLEDAIRTLSQEEVSSFEEANGELFNLVKLQRDQGNLYINFTALPAALRDIAPSLNPARIGKNAFLDLKINNQSIELDGFSFAENSDWLSILSGTRGTGFDASEVIPTSVSAIDHFTFDKGEIWGDKISEYLRSVDPQIDIKRSKIQQAIDMDVTYVYQLLKEEVAIAHTYTGNNLEGHLLVLQMSDAQIALKYFQGIQDRYLKQTGDSLLNEQFGSHNISGFPVPGFPEAMLGQIAGTFEECYMASYRNYLLFANSIPLLKNSLEQISEENTWRKSLRKNKFLAKTNQEANYSKFINVPATIRYLTGQLNEPWKSITRDNNYILKSFEHLAIQFSPIDNKYFTSILIEQPELSVVSELAPKELQEVTVGSPIITRPILLPDHSYPEKTIFIQDSGLALYKLDKDFRIEWSEKLPDKIVGIILPIDYYKNNKIQYCFITSKELHIIDRQGNSISGFPKRILGADSLQHLNLIDYDGSKSYRFAITDRSGKVFLTNKDGLSLSGWNPKKFNTPLVESPQHHRVGGKDLFIAATEEGTVHILNRKGEAYKGFPLQLEDFLSRPIYFDVGSGLKSSSITAVTRHGNLKHLDLTGSSLNISKLYKPESNTQFELLTDVGGTSYLIQRQTENRLDIINASQELLFGKDYLPGEKLFVQYYNINPAKQYIIVGNYLGHFIYIYDLDGRLITNRPLLGNQRVSMMYYEKQDELNIYIVNGANLTLYALKP
ncbi:MAG: hypothetical protein ACI9RP_002925, partial [Cyclobacteriaceae bacterium]